MNNIVEFNFKIVFFEKSTSFMNNTLNSLEKHIR